MLFPLALLGAGLVLLSLFALAARALPIGVGTAAAFGLAMLGAPAVLSLLGAVILAIVANAALRRLIAHCPWPAAQRALVLVLVMPAAVAGFSVGHALGVIIGPAALVLGLAGGAGCAWAASLVLRPPRP